MRATRSTLPYLIAAGGGALLFVSLLLSWLSGGGVSFSAWETFSGIDIVLAILALAAAAIAGARAAGAALPVTWLRAELLKWIGVIALTIVLTFVIEADNLAFGAFVAIVSAAAILAGAVLAERPDLASRLADATGVPDDTRPAAPPPAGLGSSTSTAAPAAAAPAPAEPRPAAVQPPTAAGGATVAGAGSPGTPAMPAPAQPAQSSGPPAGWYPDPQGQARLRYWDGAGWTEQTSA